MSMPGRAHATVVQGGGSGRAAAASGSWGRGGRRGEGEVRWLFHDGTWGGAFLCGVFGVWARKVLRRGDGRRESRQFDSSGDSPVEFENI